MKISILHYHLREGGVTRVIEMAWAALRDRGLDVLVISGEPAPVGTRIDPACIQIVPELRYDGSPKGAQALKDAVELAERRHWRATADVRHCHNHSLGKNFALPLVIKEWAEEGRKLLLQIHDFAENGRPANYRNLRERLGETEGLGRCLYPAAPQVGYALLTTSDAARLTEAGLPGRAHCLPNPVSLPGGSTAIDRSHFKAERLIVYPTRAIRRKNLGEVLLWAAWAEPGEQIIISGVPEQGPDVARFTEWKAFAESLQLPIFFEAQRILKRSTADFLLTADLGLTTSVAEGFGMAFLEPWLAGCALAGRDLPGVTQDFRQAGLRLESLYPDLAIEPGVLSREEVSSSVETNIRRNCAAYEVSYEESFHQEALASVWRDGRVDFGRLGEEHQRILIEAAVRSGERRPLPYSPDAVAPNRDVILREYTLEKYGERLEDIYRSLVEAAPAEPAFLDPRRVLMANLSFGDYFAVRSS